MSLTRTLTAGAPLALPAAIPTPLNASENFEACTGMPEASGLAEIVNGCRFQPTVGPAVHHAFSKNPIWFRFQYENPLAQGKARVLTLGNYAFGLIDFYAIADGKLIAERHTGAARPFASRYLEFREFTFLLPSAPEAVEIYLRIQSSTPLNFTPRIRSLADVLQKENTDQIAGGLLFGAQAILILYNLFLFMSLRDRSYLFYSFYILGWLLFETKTTGFLARYFLYALPAVDVAILPGIVYFTFAAFLLFAEHFLYPGDKSRTGRGARFFGTLLAVFSLPVMLLPQHLTIPAGIPVNLLVTCYVGWRSFRAWRMQIPSAGFFLLAVLCSLALLPVFALTRIIPVTAGFSFFHFLFHYGVPVILLIEALLLSFALADRYRRLREEKERQEAEFNALLNDEKARINAELHDVIGSDLSLMRFSLSAGRKKPRPGELEAKLDKTLLRLRELVALNNIDRDLPARLSHELAARANEFSEATGMSLRTDIDDVPLSVMAAFHVQRFFSEALTNAARHSGAKQMAIFFKKRRRGALLFICDNGRGMARQQPAALGAGLKNFTERAQRLGARFRIFSRRGRGTGIALHIDHDAQK